MLHLYFFRSSRKEKDLYVMNFRIDQETNWNQELQPSKLSLQYLDGSNSALVIGF